MARQWQRRDVLVGAGGLLTVASLAGCNRLSMDPNSDDDQPPDSGGSQAKEAPMLAEQVKSGELPALAERIPPEPLVITPVERVGTYGGTWHTMLLDAADTSWLERTVGWESLLAWRPSEDWQGTLEDVAPNLADSWRVDESAQKFTFTLKKGVKWSDGEPFTTEDIAFAMNEVINNPELSPVASFPGTATVIDDTTVEIALDEPDSLFLQLQASPSGQQLTTKPMHYLKQFHQDHNKDADAIAEQEGYRDWIELFLAKSDEWSNVELPVLTAWRPMTALGDESTVLAERNPYYWKTDPDGRQLPYLDEVEYQMVADQEVMTLKTTTGEIDFHTRHINTLQNKPVLADARQDGNFDFVKIIPSAPSNVMLIIFNLTHKNPVKREIFRNLDFRIGLSHAINREELITATLQNQGTPSQHGPRPGTRFHNERMLTQYVEYDTALANSHLDQAGYSKRDSKGIRLGPDDKPIRFRVDTTEVLGQPWAEMLELVRNYWREVGIAMEINNMDRALHQTRTAANESDAQAWEGQGGIDTLIRPGDFVPINPAQARYGRPWAEWYLSGGETGEEPPPATKNQLDLYDQLLAAADPEQQTELMKQILEIAADEFYSIGTSLLPESYGIVKNNFHNVPKTMTDSATYNAPAPTHPCQYFISENK